MRGHSGLGEIANTVDETVKNWHAEKDRLNEFKRQDTHAVTSQPQPVSDRKTE